ncbi:NUDIX hydrolase [Streptomyces sp. NPDC000594]|uniref:NUDIX hydrolase n=1 Tax=Streptomyces sp. NPDC000594 TaxID=3154261 RepID=UPI0033204F0A
MSLHDDAVRTLREYTDPMGPAAGQEGREEQEELRRAYLDHLAARPDGLWKSCSAGHLTASALIVDPERERVLLTLHRKLGMWLQMGGHCEPGDGTLAGAALREAAEESGLTGLTLLGAGSPVRLDRHPIPAPCHWHLDVQYAALAPAGAEVRISEESLDLRWFRYDEVAEVADGSVLRLLEGTRALLGAPSPHPA